MEEDFNTVAFAVRFSVDARFGLSTGVGANDGLHLLRSNLSDDFIRVVGRVCNHSFASRVRSDYLFGNRAVMLLARCDFEVERAALGVDKGMDFGGETTSRVTQCIFFDPPFPPEAS